MAAETSPGLTAKSGSAGMLSQSEQAWPPQMFPKITGILGYREDPCPPQATGPLGIRPTSTHVHARGRRGETGETGAASARLLATAGVGELAGAAAEEARSWQKRG